jgi:hypothetical protein
VLASNASANTSYGNLRSADNLRGKHDATNASTGNGRRWPWAPIRTFRSRRRERVTRRPHAYSPQTWTRPCRDELCDSARGVRRDSRSTKRGTPAAAQPVREFESRPLGRININATARFVPYPAVCERQHQGNLLLPKPSKNARRSTVSDATNRGCAGRQECLCDTPSMQSAPSSAPMLQRHIELSPIT